MPGGNDCWKQSVVLEIPTDIYPSAGIVASILGSKKKPLGSNNIHSTKLPLKKRSVKLVAR